MARELEEARGAQARVRFEGRRDERLEGIERRDGGAVGDVDEALGFDRELHGVAVDAELGGDRADLPVLGEEEAAHARAQLGRDHRATSNITSWRRSANVPTPGTSR
jgi:hypothetical protein